MRAQNRARAQDRTPPSAAAVAATAERERRRRLRQAVADAPRPPAGRRHRFAGRRGTIDGDDDDDDDDEAPGENAEDRHDIRRPGHQQEAPLPSGDLVSAFRLAARHAEAAWAGPRFAFTILRGTSPAASAEYGALPMVRPWRELARAVDPTGRLPVDGAIVWAGEREPPLRLPARFDGRVRWRGLLPPVRDQGASGACWAHAAVAALASRAAIWTAGAHRAWPDGIERPDGGFGALSPADLVARGFDASAAQIEAEADLVAANEAHLGLHHADYGQTLAGAFGSLYAEGVGCDGARGWRCRSLAHYGLASTDEADIKAEIFAWGPVAAAFVLHRDFAHPRLYPGSWAGGVYRHDPAACPGPAVGGHAVLIVGWTEAVLPTPRGPVRHTCWIARHAWSAGWGRPSWSSPPAAAAHGYGTAGADDADFLIAAGQCDLEANVVACVPDICGMHFDARNAHRLAPPSRAARMRRAAPCAPGDDARDLAGSARIDAPRLPDMGAFVAAEAGPPALWIDAGGETGASDAWSAALRRSTSSSSSLSFGHGSRVPAVAAVAGIAPQPVRDRAQDDVAFFPSYREDADQHPHGARAPSTGPNEDAPSWSHVPERDRRIGDDDDDDHDGGDYHHGGVDHGANASGHDPMHPHHRTGAVGLVGNEDAGYYSNSDAELSDEERRLDEAHGRRRRRRRAPG
jgi:hypothetical protein